MAHEATIYVPATNQHFRSDDGGKTWRQTGIGLGQNRHPFLPL